MYTGNYTDVPCPEQVTAENLADALRQMDPVLKFRPVTGEKCIVNCPLFGEYPCVAGTAAGRGLTCPCVLRLLRTSNRSNAKMSKIPPKS